MTDQEKTAVIALRAAAGATNRSVRELGLVHGSFLAAATATLPNLAREAAAAARTRLESAGVALIAHDEAGYPASLREVADFPLLLFVRGSIVPADDPAVAIVGSRRATPEGQRIARALAQALAGLGVTVVSGLARGIDGVAHAGALEAGGRSLAVLGSGIDVLYPPEHRDLAGRLAGQGAVISELAPGAPPLPWHFPMRNRILAGLVRAVVVVEAAEHSGSLITAHLANDAGRTVLAVPGSPLAETHRGTNQLIREGAVLLQSLEDLFDELPPAVRARIRERRVEAETPPSDEETRVLDLLDLAEARCLDTLSSLSSLAPPRLLAVLAALELRGWAAKLPGSRWRKLGRLEPLHARRATATGSVLSSGVPYPYGVA